jgi:hypothetical protein
MSRLRALGTCGRDTYLRLEQRVLGYSERRPAVALGALLMGLGAGKTTGPLPHSLYATVAQVLPVFMVVAVIEGRYFHQLERRPKFERFFLGGFLLLPLAAEIVAIAELAIAHDPLFLRALVLVGGGCALLLVWVYATLGPTRGVNATTLMQAENVQRTVGAVRGES